MPVSTRTSKSGQQGDEDLKARKLILGPDEYIILVPRSFNTERGITCSIHHSSKSPKLDAILKGYPEYRREDPSTFPDLRIAGLSKDLRGQGHHLIHGKGISTHHISLNVKEVQLLTL